MMEAGCREFRVTACCDPIRERAENRAAAIAEFQGRKPAVFASVEALKRADVAQAADLCLPHYAHHLVAIDLLDSGFHVLVEKPLGLTVRASRAMIAAAERAQRILATAENVRRDLAPRAWTWALREQKLAGDIHLGVVQAVAFRLFNLEDSAFVWRNVKLLGGGGMIMDSGAHFADMLQVLFGEPETITCRTEALDRRPLRDVPVLGTAECDVEDTWHAVIRFPDGPEVAWTYSRSLPGRALQNAMFFGTQGTVLAKGFPFHPFQGGGEAHLAGGRVVSNEEVLEEYRAALSEDEERTLFPYGCTGGFAVEIYDFIRAVRTGGAPEMDGIAGLRAKALCEACFESAALDGRVVRYGDVLSGNVRNYQAPIDAYWGLE